MTVQDRYSQYTIDQRKFFDELITEDWLTYFSQEWDYARNYEVRRLFRKIRPSRILDIGCGCGYHDKIMADYPFVESVDAIDYSPKSVEKANETYPHPKVRRDVASLQTFSPDCRYDLVVSFQVIEHLDDLDGYFCHARRLCNRSRYVAVLTPNKLTLQNRSRIRRDEPPCMIDPMHFQEYSLNDLREMASRHSLREIDRFGHSLGPTDIPGLQRAGYKLRVLLGAMFPSISQVIGMVFCNAAVE